MARQAGQAPDPAVAQATAPGMIAAAGDRDRMLQERAARRLNVGGGQPARPGTMVWLAWMTKPGTSIAALRLAGQRGLDPGQRPPSRRPSENHRSWGIRRGLPKAAQPARQATVRHLLTHTAGPSCTRS
jgi:CubicO group peptidase (beta-lactamase class C family)